MENYIALLLLVVPGFIAKHVYGKINSQISTEDKFDNIITALIFSIFIMLLNYLVLNFFGIIESVTFLEITTLFGTVNFVLKYTLITLVTAVIVAFVWDNIEPLCMDLINKYRDEKKRNHVSRDTVFSKSFNDNQSHLISVEKDDKELFRGLILHINSGTKEMYIQAVEDANLITDIKGKYYDFEKNIQITEYKF